MTPKNTGFRPESLRLIAAALALHQAERIATSITPLPGTDRFIAIGTPAEVARLLEIAPVARQSPAPIPEQVAQGEFLDAEVIKTLWKERGGDGVPAAFRFARAIERLLAAQSAKQGAQPELALIPKWAGEFATHQQWVNTAQRVLSVPDHKPKAICIDAKGRRCHIGADMARARDEGAFPVRYFWECELTAPAAPLQAAKQGAQDNRTSMDDKQAYEWAWSQVKSDVGTKGWTVGEHGNYFGFFLHGWRYGKQYGRQGTTAAPAAPLQTMDDTTRDEALEEAAQACESEIVENSGLREQEDHNYAVSTCAKLIRAMKSSPASTDGDQKGRKS